MHEPSARAVCLKCRLARVVCDCASIEPFGTDTEFILLMHPEEARRKIATGRLTHHFLRNSRLRVGESFETLDVDPSRQAVVLYPGPQSMDLGESWREPEKPLTVFVLDGTWRTAKKMLRLSPILQTLPQIRFEPPHLSRFRIRKQPAEVCFSTLEAVHHLIGALEPARLERDRLLTAFDRMVERQIEYARENR